MIQNYKGEMIILISVLVLGLSWTYKYNSISVGENKNKLNVTKVGEIKEVGELKKYWGSEDITKKVDKIKNIISVKDMKWTRTGKKLLVTYKSLTGKEMTRVINKFMNTQVQIVKLDVKKVGSNYNMEVKCKW